MKDYQLRICEALQHDIKELGGGEEWGIDIVYLFWLDWSNKLSASFLDYKQGDFNQLKWAIELLSEPNSESNEQLTQKA